MLADHQSKQLKATDLEPGTIAAAVTFAIDSGTGITDIVSMIRSYYDSAEPAAGCTEAIQAISDGLDSSDFARTRSTLAVLDTLYKNCGSPFAVALTQDLDGFKNFIESPNTNAENKQQLLGMIAEWVVLDLDKSVHKHLDLTPKLRQFFEALVRAGYEFPLEHTEQLPPGTIERLRTENNAAWRGLFGVRFKTVR
ncbi:hypothetical protein BJ741DRAFT_609529 [Chytriomyces cf. hyalinus JEL632]|nr:hypothetical protein BJ741DRAFT_609529 [Chytriomyces cf. hyalinus JEL632]